MVAIYPIFEAREDKRANVIFFHGLDGDSHTSWGAKTKDAIDEHFWPAWLKGDIGGLSVYSVGYRAHLSNWEGPSPHFFLEAWEIFDLLLDRPELRTGPLYLIGHSLGGLVIKQIIRTAAGDALLHDEAKRFLGWLEKIIFLGTPHLGADLAGFAKALRESPTVRDLERDNPHLRDLHRWYGNWADSRKIAHLSMYETKPVELLGLIVDRRSADPGVKYGAFLPAQDCDHFAIAKPKSINSPVYKSVCAFLKSPAQTFPRIAAGTVELAVAAA